MKRARSSLSTRFCPKKGKIKEKGKGMLPGSGGSGDILNPESGCVIPRAPGEYSRAFFPTAPFNCEMCGEAGHGD